MKHFFFFLFLVTILTSCQKDNAVSRVLSDEGANLIALNYLVLIGDSYQLNLTEQDAEKMNISTAQYAKMLESIKSVNYIIKDIRRKGQSIHLFNPSEEKESSLNSKAIHQTLHTIETFGNNLVKEMADFGNFGRVCVSIWCGGLIDVCYYSVESGGRLYSGGRVCAFGWHICGEDDLHIDTPDINAIYGFQTMNSNGGRCTFTGIDE